MPDADKATLTEEKETMNGVERIFAYPNSYDLAELIRAYRKFRLAPLLESLDLANASENRRLTELAAFHTGEQPLHIKFFDEPEGRAEGLRIILRRHYGDEAEKIARDSDWSDARTAKFLTKFFNFSYEPIAPNPGGLPATYGKDAADPKPANMQTYGDGSDPTRPAK